MEPILFVIALAAAAALVARMADNYFGTGDDVSYTNSGSTTIASGDAVALTGCIGVAMADIAAGAVGTLKTRGVFLITKTAGEAWTLGQQLYLIAATGVLTTTAGSNIAAGKAWAAAESADTTGYCSINA
jgi:predicted RecA/RadA family phage recombinase